MGIIPAIKDRLSRNEVAAILDVTPACVSKYSIHGWPGSGGRITLHRHEPLGKAYYLRADVEAFVVAVADWKRQKEQRARAIPGMRQNRKQAQAVKERLARHGL